jgi:Secretion system C-terminal sorting domain
MKKNYVLLILGLVLCFTDVSAKIIRSRQSGGWGDTATWLGFKVPNISLSDSVIISNNTSVYLTDSVEVHNLLIETFGILSNTDSTNGTHKRLFFTRYPKIKINGVTPSQPNGLVRIIIDGIYTGGGETIFNGNTGGSLTFPVPSFWGLPSYFREYCDKLSGIGTINTTARWIFNGDGVKIDSNANLTFTHSDIQLTGVYKFRNFGKITLINGRFSFRVTPASPYGFITTSGRLYNYPTGSLKILNNDLIGMNFIRIYNAGYIYIGGDVDASAANVSSTEFRNFENGYLEFKGDFIQNNNLSTISGVRIVADYKNNTVEYSGKNQIIKTPCNRASNNSIALKNYSYYHLICSDSGTKFLSDSIIILGNLKIKDTAQLDVMKSTHKIRIKGDWTNTSIHPDAFVENTGLVVFSGDTTQFLSTVNLGGESFNKLQMNNTNKNANSGLYIFQNVNTKQLILDSGIIHTGSNKVNVLDSMTSAVKNHNKLSYIDGNLQRIISGNAGKYDFPIGNSTAYELASLKFINSHSVNEILAKFTNSSGNNGLPITNGTNVYSNLLNAGGAQSGIGNVNPGIWNFTVVNGSGSANYDLKLFSTNYSNATLSNAIVNRLNNSSNWLLLGLPQTAIGTQPIVSETKNLSGFGSFAIAQDTTSTLIGDNICQPIQVNTGTFTYNNTFASNQANEPLPPTGGCTSQNSWCGSQVNKTLWFKFTAPASGRFSITANRPLHPNNNDVKLALWKAKNNICDSLFTSSGRTLIAANDNISATNSAAKIETINCRMGNEVYFIQVEVGNINSIGSFELKIIDEGFVNTTISGVNSSYCADYNSAPIQLNASNIGGAWNSNNNSVTSLGQYTPSNYFTKDTITYTMLGCYNFTKVVIIDSLPIVNAYYNFNPLNSDSLTICALQPYDLSYYVSPANCNLNYNFFQGINYSYPNQTSNPLNYINPITATDPITGCKASDTIFVTDNPQFPLLLGGTYPNFSSPVRRITTCDDTLNLDAGNPGAIFNWNNGSTNQIVNIAANGIYSVVVTNGFGCQNSDSVEVIVNDSTNVVGINSNPYNLLPNSSINFCPSNSFNPSSSITQLYGTPPNGTFSSNNGSVNTNGEFALTNGTSIINYIYSSSCGIDTAVLSINVDSFPISFTVLPKDTICFGDSLTLKSQFTASVNLYGWYENNIGIGQVPFGSFGLVIDSIKIKPQASAIYSFFIEDTIGCYFSLVKPVIVNPIPTANLSSTYQSSCSSVVLDAGNSGNNYLWNTGATGQTIVATSSGSYHVTVTNLLGCKKNDTTVVSLIPNTGISIVNPGSDTVCASSGTISLQGLPVGGTFSPNTVNGIFIPTTLGSFQVSYIYSDSCGTDTAIKTIVVNLCSDLKKLNQTPKTFSIIPNPNNGQFNIQCNESINAQIEVYNDLGKIVKTDSMNGYAQPIYMKDYPAGIYTVVIKTNQGIFSKRIIILE